MRIGIVGCGAIAEYLHVPAIQRCTELQLTAFVDTNAQQRQHLASRCPGAVQGETIEQVVKHIDAVVLATPPHCRVSLVKQAADLGIHVLCEKPLANSVEDCLEIEAVRRRAGIQLAVMHQFRCWPNRIACGEIIQSDPDALLGISVAQGNPYSWQSATGYSVQRHLVSGGVLINAGVHPLDSVISWLGDPVSTQYTDDACGGLESNLRIEARFVGKVPVTVRLSRTCRLENTIRLRLADRELVMNNSDPYSYRVEVPTAAGARRDSVVACGSDEQEFLGPAVTVYKNFASAIVSGEPLIVDANEATRVIRWIESCYDQKQQRDLPAAALTPGACW